MGGVPYNLSAPLTRVDSILCKGSIKSCSKLQIKMLCKQERIPYLHIGAHCPTLSCGSGAYAALIEEGVLQPCSIEPAGIGIPEPSTHSCRNCKMPALQLLCAAFVKGPLIEFYPKMRR